MFANGTEYHCFLEVNCYKCKKYVDFEDATEDKTVCQIEEKIAIGGKEMFPYDKLTPNGFMCRYTCNEFEEEHQCNK